MLEGKNEVIRTHSENDHHSKALTTPTVEGLRAAAPSLYDVALRVLEVNKLVQHESSISPELRLKLAVIHEFAELAIGRAKGAR